MGSIVQFGKRKPQAAPFGARPPVEPPIRRWTRRTRPRLGSWAAMLVGAVFIGGPIALELGPPLVGCSIKGNISVNTGERIYHIPGQEDYWRTRINWLKGERWFCSEMAARQAGWRNARN